jgi:hypothetical protein
VPRNCPVAQQTHKGNTVIAKTHRVATQIAVVSSQCKIVVTLHPAAVRHVSKLTAVLFIHFCEFMLCYCAEHLLVCVHSSIAVYTVLPLSTL